MAFGHLLLEQGKVKQAAEAFAASTLQFEAAVVLLMEAGDKLALQRYLQLRLDALSPKHKPQRTLLATWLLEVFLDRLALLDGGWPARPARAAG